MGVVAAALVWPVELECGTGQGETHPTGCRDPAGFCGDEKSAAWVFLPADFQLFFLNFKQAW